MKSVKPKVQDSRLALSAGGAPPPGINDRGRPVGADDNPRNPKMLDMLPRLEDEQNSKNVLSSERERNIKPIEVLDVGFDQDKESLISYSSNNRAASTAIAESTTAEVNDQYSTTYRSDDVLAQHMLVEAQPPIKLMGVGGNPLGTAVLFLMGIALSTGFSLFRDFRKKK